MNLSDFKPLFLRGLCYGPCRNRVKRLRCNACRGIRHCVRHCVLPEQSTVMQATIKKSVLALAAIGILWAPSAELLYEHVAGANQTVSEYHFKLNLTLPAPVKFYKYSIDKQGRFTVYPGYMWDGASGPTVDTPDTIKASLGHDAGYEAIRRGHLPPEAKAVIDRWFHDQLIRDGVPDFRAYAWYRGVDLFGRSSTLAMNQRPVLRAPIPFDRAMPGLSPIPGYPIIV